MQTAVIYKQRSIESVEFGGVHGGVQRTERRRLDAASGQSGVAIAKRSLCDAKKINLRNLKACLYMIYPFVYLVPLTTEQRGSTRDH